MDAESTDEKDEEEELKRSESDVCRDKQGGRRTRSENTGTEVLHERTHFDGAFFLFEKRQRCAENLLFSVFLESKVLRVIMTFSSEIGTAGERVWSQEQVTSACVAGR